VDLSKQPLIPQKLSQIKKAALSDEYFLRQLGHAEACFSTRRFPHPSHGGFGFIGNTLI
jgi:hypothetical protein